MIVTSQRLSGKGILMDECEMRVAGDESSRTRGSAQACPEVSLRSSSATHRF